MWPWGHAVVGYLLYALASYALRRRLPTNGQALVVVAATQLPDVVDKPLAWWLQLLPSGRSLGHSLLTATVIVAAVALVARRYDRRDLAVAFGVGYLSGILTDLPGAVLAGEFSQATFLLWPILSAPEYGSRPDLGDLVALGGSPVHLLQFGLFAVTACLVLGYGVRGIAKQTP